MAQKNDWVQIHSIVLPASQRAPQVPDDTKQVPLETWVKGYLLNEKAEIGDEVDVTTVTGRTEHGTLVQVNPTYSHSFGKFVPEILEIDRILQKELAGGE